MDPGGSFIRICEYTVNSVGYTQHLRQIVKCSDWYPRSGKPYADCRQGTVRTRSYLGQWTREAKSPRPAPLLLP